MFRLIIRILWLEIGVLEKIVIRLLLTRVMVAVIITILLFRQKQGKSVTVMAENLNIGEMVLGENNQSDDTKIERYCYNNDTTKCDEFGGLYQWAEMMQLPSRCTKLE